MIGIHSAIIGHRAAGMGTIDGWSLAGNPTITKGPKESLELPRKTRVGEDNLILDNVEMAYDRIKEAILPYARGVDPMVSVMMQNTNGGQQASLPYKLGVFRPPVMRQEDLLPLSRLPHKHTSVTQWSKFPDPYVKDRAIEQRPDLMVVQGTVYASARPDLPHQTDVPSLHGTYEARLFAKQSADIERQMQAPPRISNLVTPQAVSATTVETRKLMHSLPQDTRSLPAALRAGRVDANTTFNPHVRVENGRNPHALRSAVQLDMTPHHQSNYALQPAVGQPSLGNTLHIDYTTPQATRQQFNQHPVADYRTREPHRISSMRDALPVVEYSHERLLPQMRDRAVSRQSFTVR